MTGVDAQVGLHVSIEHDLGKALRRDRRDQFGSDRTTKLSSGGRRLHFHVHRRDPIRSRIMSC